MGGEWRISVPTSGDQSQPAVAGLKDGGFVAVWQSNGEDGSKLGVYGRRYGKTGAAAGGEFRVNTTTQNDQSLPAVAGLTGGGFVVVWQSSGQDKSGLGIYAQRYDAAGRAVGGEFRVNAVTVKDQSQPAIAALGNGGFVVVWQSSSQDGSGLGVYGQRYSATGKAAAPKEFLINSHLAGDQSQPAVAALKDGGFVAAWQSAAQDGSGLGVYAQRYTSGGGKAGGELRVNTTTAQDQWQPAVAAFSDGGFVVAWTSNAQDGSGKGVYAHAYDAAGKPVDVEFAVNTTTLKDQWQPSAAAFAGGKFVVVWTSVGQDTSLEGVYGQRFQMLDVAPK
jgi:hypothetical protein